MLDFRIFATKRQKLEFIGLAANSKRENVELGLSQKDFLSLRSMVHILIRTNTLFCSKNHKLNYDNVLIETFCVVREQFTINKR